ncbi:hypothetical protein ABIA24_006768 [Sinorhizobium fredii]|uniref:hypothetical protein n=1 Tax=Rhizobium fredii TaxID=380 RepID=UPI0035151B49
MSIVDQYEAPSMTEPQRRNAVADMAAIVRGEELDLPWRRIRVLLDHKLAMVQHPVLAQGSLTSLGLTDKGLQFMGLEQDLLPPDTLRPNGQETSRCVSASLNGLT